MRELSVKEIVKATGAKVARRGGRENVGGVSTDTRKIKNRDLFIALKGNNFNGHDFIQSAITKGACCVICQRSDRKKLRDLSIEGVTVLEVTDTLKALGDLAGHYRSTFDIPLVGITGSSGKTTSKEMAAKVLSSRFSVLKNEGTENNLVGLPRTLFRLDAAHDIGVLELGTNQFGEIRRLTSILKPRIGVITNIGPSHLEFLRSEAGVLKEKSELLRSLGRNGTAFINADDRLLSKIRKPNCRTIKFGIDSDADFRATKIAQDKGSICFTVNPCYDFKIRVLGAHNIYNALIAIAIGFTCEVEYEEIYRALYDFQPVAGRLCLKRAGWVDIIDDTYNSNPQSISAAIDALRDYRAPARKFFVCADMLELGEDSELFHEKAGESIAAAGFDYLVSVGNFSGTVERAALKRGMDRERIFSCLDNAGALEFLRDNVKEGDCLLFKGSRRMRLEGLMSALMSFLDSKKETVRT